MSATGGRGGAGGWPDTPPRRLFIRPPLEGEALEASTRACCGSARDPARAGLWLTLAPKARIEIGAGCFLNRNTMLAALESIEIGDHTMFANGCFVGDSPTASTTPRSDHPAGLHLQVPVRIG